MSALCSLLNKGRLGTWALSSSASLLSSAKDLLDETRTILHAERAVGSIKEVGWRFQPFEISNLEMVAQIFTRWNRIESWLERVHELNKAA